MTRVADKADETKFAEGKPVWIFNGSKGGDRARGIDELLEGWALIFRDKFWASWYDENGLDIGDDGLNTAETTYDCGCGFAVVSKVDFTTEDEIEDIVGGLVHWASFDRICVDGELYQLVQGVTCV